MISSLVAKLFVWTLKALKTHFPFNDDISSNKKRLLLLYVEFGAKTLMIHLKALPMHLLNFISPNSLSLTLEALP